MSNTEKLFHVLDETTEMIGKEMSLSYLEALAESAENLFQKNLPETLSDEAGDQLVHIYQSVDTDDEEAETIRKAFQMAVLKGMKEATQPNHEMTPDAVALFVSYLVNKVTDGKQSLSVMDPAVGTGNLLTAILNGHSSISLSTGIDADDLLLRLAYVSANLQKHTTQFYHQDAIRPLLLDPVDLVVSDLPIGYYPNEEFSSSYRLHTESERPYIHHLLMEQSLYHTVEGGFLIFLIPNGLFQSDQTEQLNAFIKDQAVVQGLLQLPLSMFKKEQHAKSIFILQKKGPGVKPPSQALFVDLPSFSNQRAMENIIGQIDGWFSQHF